MTAMYRTMYFVCYTSIEVLLKTKVYGVKTVVFITYLANYEGRPCLLRIFIVTIFIHGIGSQNVVIIVVAIISFCYRI